MMGGFHTCVFLSGDEINIVMMVFRSYPQQFRSFGYCPRPQPGLGFDTESTAVIQQVYYPAFQCFIPVWNDIIPCLNSRFSAICPSALTLDGFAIFNGFKNFKNCHQTAFYHWIIPFHCGLIVSSFCRTVSRSRMQTNSCRT